MSKNDEPDFSHSLTDLMTSVAVVFLIIAVAMICIMQFSKKDKANKYAQLEEEDRRIRKTKEKLLNELIKILELKAKGLSYSTIDDCVTIKGNSPYKIYIQFNGQNDQCKNRGLFFENKSFQLKGEIVRPTIKSLSKLYSNLCNEEIREGIERVQILGHTDSNYTTLDSTCPTSVALSPNSTSYKTLQCGNLFLSAQRAKDVFLKIGEELISSNAPIMECFTKITEISGRGPFDSKENKNAASLGSDRRVEIIINFNQPSIKKEMHEET